MSTLTMSVVVVWVLMFVTMMVTGYARIKECYSKNGFMEAAYKIFLAIFLSAIVSIFVGGLIGQAINSLPSKKAAYETTLSECKKEVGPITAYDKVGVWPALIDDCLKKAGEAADAVPLFVIK